MTVYDGYFEVSRDWASGVDIRGLVDAGYDFLIVGYERGDYGASMFGDSFMPLRGARSIDEALQLLVSGRAVDDFLGLDFYYEIWSLVDGMPDWLRDCCEWCELVDSYFAEAIYHVHVANSGHDFVPVFQFGHDLFVPSEPCTSAYDLAWLCDDVRGGRFGKLTVLFSAWWLTPAVIHAVDDLVRRQSAYDVCGDAEDKINAEFDEWLESMSTTIYAYEERMLAGL